jgi:hypothetical protein
MKSKPFCNPSDTLLFQYSERYPKPFLTTPYISLIYGGEKKGGKGQQNIGALLDSTEGLFRWVNLTNRN